MPKTSKRHDPDLLSLQAHRRIIGTLGLLLPALVYLLAGVRPTPGLQPWKLLTSVSAYYYTGAVGVFVGVLFALSLFLFTYKGYKEVWADRIVGKVGGLAAIVVALFPTGAPTDRLALPWWSEATGVVHYIAAIVLFGAFISFSLWLFRRSEKDDPRDQPPEKRVRNAVFFVCGLVMVLAVGWAAFAKKQGGAIFLPESIAIGAFAFSWLVKGELPPFMWLAEKTGGLIRRRDEPKRGPATE
jgi:hypothetical protein